MTTHKDNSQRESGATLQTRQQPKAVHMLVTMPHTCKQLNKDSEDKYGSVASDETLSPLGGAKNSRN